MISPGKILYNLYYKPLGAVSKWRKTGIRRSVELERGRKEMMDAARNLSEICHPGKETYEVYFLTGKKYWYQTAFCLYSLQKQAGVNIRAFVMDDGSFDEELETQVRNQFPSSVVVRKEKIQELLDSTLPEAQFPVLRKRRLEYPHLRKLTDIHILPGSKPKLVLDSDMLFFKKPKQIMNWLQHPNELLFMKDIEESYGYSQTLMKELTGASEIPDKLNVGVAGIPSSKIDWQKLERWTGEMLKREGSSYLQEQALTAMIAANESYIFLDEQAYKVMPSIQGNTIPEILHHYVADSKYDYFVKGWKKIIT